MMLSAVDIVIVNWNSGPLLAACLQSLAASDVSRVDQVLVVDNGSVDGSADVEVGGLPLRVIKAGDNLGFGRACNLAAANGRAPYVLFLNPDTEVFQDTVNGVLAYLDQPENTDVAVAGIRLVDRNGVAQRHCARFPSWLNLVGEATGLSQVAPALVPPIRMREFDHMTSRDVDHVIGAFYCIRRTVFERIGGFDESYFVYYEDLDLSKRVARLGLRRRFLAQVSAYHREGGTSEQIRARRLYYAVAGRLTYASKHLPSSAAAAAWAAALLLEPFARTVLAASRGSFADAVATWQGFAMLYRSLARRLCRTPLKDR